MQQLPANDLQNVMNRVLDIWPSRKVILITGGTGFFGSWLIGVIDHIEKQMKLQNKYIILSRKSPEENILKNSVLSAKYFEIRQQDLISNFEISEKIDYVIHAASDVNSIKANGDVNYEAIYQGTVNLIQALPEDAKAKFLFVSSGGVYKNHQEPVSENEMQETDLYPVLSYSDAKIKSEYFIKQNLGNYCIARCFSFVGPMASEKMAAMSMLLAKVKKQTIVVNSPQTVRSFMYPTDLAVALFKLLFMNNDFRTYNVGSDQAMNLKQLAQKVAVLGEENSSVEVKDSVSSSPSLAGQYYCPSVKLYEQEYGPAVTLGLDEALKKTYNFLKQENINEKL